MYASSRAIHRGGEPSVQHTRPDAAARLVSRPVQGWPAALSGRLPARVKGLRSSACISLRFLENCGPFLGPHPQRAVAVTGRFVVTILPA
jgi:hypothetical protein